MTYSQEEIVQGIVDGDRKVLQFLYTTVGASIVGHVIKNSGSQKDGEEFFRMALITVRNKIINQDYNDQGKIEAYIFNVGRNHWLNELRKRKKKAERETTLTEKENWVADTTRSVVEKIVQEEEVSHLHKCIKMLGEVCQKFFQMHYFEEMTMVEIAELEDAKAATIRKRHSDCKKKLKKIMLAQAIA